MVAFGPASANLTLTYRGDRAGCASHERGWQARYSVATTPVTLYIGAVSYADSLSCACGAYASQFSLFVFS